MSDMNNSYYQQPADPNQSFDYTPISMWGYFGYQLLFAIPCAGLICIIIFAFGGTRNINLRNFARSYFCLFIIGIVFYVIFALFAVLLAFSS